MSENENESNSKIERSKANIKKAIKKNKGILANQVNYKFGFFKN